MTGYNAQDMATQGADGFRDGYKAGYADAKTAAPAIDLEQFREAVQGWRDSGSNEQADGLISMAEWLVIADRADRLLALIDASPKGGAQPVAGSAVRALPARWFNEKTGLSAIGCANELTNALAKDDAVASPKGGTFHNDGDSEARDEALNTLARMFHNGEEMEGPDGMAVSVDLALWNEASEAFDVLIGDYDAETLATGTPAAPGIDLDALAQEIRRVDGTHSLGAGALAEALVEWLSRHVIDTSPKGEIDPLCAAKRPDCNYPACGCTDASPKGGTFHNDGNSEAQFIADEARLNCPACGGSGHVDDSSNGGSDAAACMHATDLASLLWRELSNNGFLIGGPDFESVAHPIDKARFLAIAETVQDAMQATSAEVVER